MTLNDVVKIRQEFLKSSGKSLNCIYLTRDEMQELSGEMENFKVQPVGRLRPDLLPPVRPVVKLTPGCTIYGMRIIEKE